MNNKVYISAKTAKQLLLELLSETTMLNDKDVIDAVNRTVQKIPSKTPEEGGGHLSKLVIDQKKRIYFPEYSDKELKLQSLPKTIFIFFILNLEGAHLKLLDDHLDNLNNVYNIVAVEKNADALRLKKTIVNLVSSAKNRIYEICSIIKRELKNIIPEELIEHYCIVGERGKRHRITLDRNLVEIKCGELSKYIKW